MSIPRRALQRCLSTRPSILAARPIRSPPSAFLPLLRSVSDAAPNPSTPSVPVVPVTGATSGKVEVRASGKKAGWSHPPRLNVPETRRPLPNIESYYRQITLALIAGAIGWVIFFTHVANQEKLSSSVFRQVMFVLRTSEKVHDVCGEGIHLESTWWTGGEPWIEGTINVLKGKADLSFRIKGHKDSGRVYFTSIRQNAESAFQVIRFKILADKTGEETELVKEMQGRGYDVDIETTYDD